MTIGPFSGEYSWLSNFYYSPMWLQHSSGTPVRFPTAEHAYQACKSLDIKDWYYIAGLATPSKAKRAGRRLNIRPDWDEVRVQMMRLVVSIKFKSHVLGTLLCDTGKSELIESNFWHDNFWGDCACPTCKSIPGENMLGKILMQVRNELQARLYVTL